MTGLRFTPVNFVNPVTANDFKDIRHADLMEYTTGKTYRWRFGLLPILPVSAESPVITARIENGSR